MRVRETEEREDEGAIANEVRSQAEEYKKEETTTEEDGNSGVKQKSILPLNQ